MGSSVGSVEAQRGNTMNTARGFEEMFGVDAEQINEWEAMASAGTLPGEPAGEVVRGPGHQQADCGHVGRETEEPLREEYDFGASEPNPYCGRFRRHG